MHKVLGWDLCTIHKSHIAPTEHGDLIASAPNLKGFALGVDSVALVDVINTIGEPYATVAAVCLNCVDGLARIASLYALGGNLIAALVDNGRAVLKSETIIVSEFENGANVNHSMYLSFFGNYIISQTRPFVKPFMGFFLRQIAQTFGAKNV